MENSLNMQLRNVHDATIYIVQCKFFLKSIVLVFFARSNEYILTHTPTCNTVKEFYSR